jgi:hypothetical protein
MPLVIAAPTAAAVAHAIHCFIPLIFFIQILSQIFPVVPSLSFIPDFCKGILLKTSLGDTAQRPLDSFAHHLPHIFSVIFHKNARAYTKYALRFLFHLTKNLTAHLMLGLCAVLPLK